MITHTFFMRAIGGAMLILLIVGLVVIHTSRIRKKILWTILLAVVWAVGYFGISILPLEEPLLVFDTPEEAFHFKYDDNYEIELIIEGNESAQVISYDRQRRSYYTVILPKAEKGWNPEIQMYRRNAAQIMSPRHGTILVHRFRNTDDFYLSIIYTGSTPGELFDNRGTEFLDRSGKVYAGENLHFGNVFYAFVDGMDENYVLTVDGEEFTLSKAK